MGILLSAFSVLIPGGGAIIRRKYFRAAALIVLFLGLLQVYLLVKAIHPAGLPAWTEPAVLAGIIAILAANAAFEAYILVRGRGVDARARLESLYSQALGAYIRGDDGKASELLRAASRLDGLNADVLFLRAQVAARQGHSRRAGRLFRKCMDFDEKGKWGWETQTALNRL